MHNRRGVGSFLLLLEGMFLLVVIVLGIMATVKKSGQPKTDFSLTEQEERIETTEAIHNSSTEEIQEDTEGVQDEERAEDSQQQLESMFSEEVVAHVLGMRLEEKVARLFLTSPESLTQNQRVTIAGDGTKTALSNYPVAGLVYTEKNYIGREQFAALLAGAQTYYVQTTGETLFLAAQNLGEENRLAISSVSDTGSLLNLVASKRMQGNEERITYPVSFPNEQQQISDSVPYVWITNTKEEQYIEETVPYTCVSQKAVDEIRNTYGYHGVVIAGDMGDADVMSSLPNGEAAVMALRAGADLILQTDGFLEAYEAVCLAASEEESLAERVDEALCRILTLKYSMPQPTDGDILRAFEQRNGE